MEAKIILFIYVIIGIFITMYIWHKEYANEYEELKKSEEVDEPMAILFMLCMAMFWPLVICKYLIKKDNNG